MEIMKSNLYILRIINRETEFKHQDGHEGFSCLNAKLRNKKMRRGGTRMIRGKQVGKD